jgi:hypothetical protein
MLEKGQGKKDDRLLFPLSLSYLSYFFEIVIRYPSFGYRVLGLVTRIFYFPDPWTPVPEALFLKPFNV